MITPLKGSGPVPGVLEMSNRCQSNKAIKNYFPSNKVQTRGGTVIVNNIEFVFAPKTNTFLVGRPKYISDITGHPALARMLGYEPKDDNLSGVQGEPCTKKKAEESQEYKANLVRKKSRRISGVQGKANLQMFKKFFKINQ